jgi:hypothetical protein
MKKLLIFAVFAVFGYVASTSAQENKEMKGMQHSMKGYLVDKMCASGMVKKAPEEAMKKAAKHTKACALEEGCKESGYGIVTNGKFFKFDENGDKQAVAFLNKTSLKSDIFVEVSGMHEGETMKVSSIKVAKKK